MQKKLGVKPGLAQQRLSAHPSRTPTWFPKCRPQKLKTKLQIMGKTHQKADKRGRNLI